VILEIEIIARENGSWKVGVRIKGVVTASKNCQIGM
jgi:hypothetical protein